jgi:hypothetical protein
MSTKQRLTGLVILCSVTTLVGCASTGPRVSESLFDKQNLQGAKTTSSAGLCQPLILNERAFRKPDIDAGGTTNLDELQHFQTSAGPRENFSALDESGEGQINWTEFFKQATRDSDLCHFFANTDEIYGGAVSWDKELFRQPGWQLFSIRF